MDAYIKTLLEKYQVRKTTKQKDQFIEWVQEEINQMGYKLRVQELKNSRNLIVGDPKSSQVILSAHYDTQPNALIHIRTAFSNYATYLLSQIFAILPIFIGFFILDALMLSIAVKYPQASLIMLVFLILSLCVVLIFTVQISYGFANKHTANDNTSGVATLLKTMHDLPESLRDKVCFVFFDHEEIGLVGSKRFKSVYKDRLNKPLINFDCVADGETYVFVLKKAFRNSDEFSVLQQSVKGLQKPFDFKKASLTPYPSDQIWFKQGVGVVAAKRNKVFGYYLNNIHTKRDTIFQYENIIDLSAVMIDFIKNI